MIVLQANINYIITSYSNQILPFHTGITNEITTVMLQRLPMVLLTHRQVQQRKNTMPYFMVYLIIIFMGMFLYCAACSKELTSTCIYIALNEWLTWNEGEF